MNNIKTWKDFLADEQKTAYYSSLKEKVDHLYSTQTVFPAREHIFAAMEACPLEKTKVVILGQDPYHGDNQAHGLAFSVQPGQKVPPSLVNIYKEIYKSEPAPKCGNLLNWAKQGVLLLNTTLTVTKACPNSHQSFGWQTLTDNAIKLLNQSQSPIVFLLWGSHAISKKTFITNPSHLVLTAPHPSPLSAHRGFLGCGHFEKANEFLKKNNLSEIIWKQF